MIKAQGNTPSSVPAVSPQRIFLPDTHTNILGFVYAKCRGFCTSLGGAVLRPRNKVKGKIEAEFLPQLGVQSTGQIQGYMWQSEDCFPRCQEGADQGNWWGPPPFNI